MNRRKKPAQLPGDSSSNGEASSSAATSALAGGRTPSTPPTSLSTPTTGEAHASGTTTPDESDDPSSPPKRLMLERTARPTRIPFGNANRLHSYTLKAPGTPWHELDLSEVPWLQVDEAKPKGVTRYRRLFFALGIALGAALAWMAAQHSSMSNITSQLSSMGIDFPSFDFDLTSSVRMPGEFAELSENLFSTPREWLRNKDFGVGRALQAQGMHAQHPVVLVPGIISTGLESWTTDETSSGFFRKRLWGSATMMRTIVFEKERWIRHISLDPDTGLDPPGIKVRASEGFDGASHFVAGYWIWAKIIENLAVLGYDINNLWMASYDWRLSFHNLQVRDRFFTRMKLRIEQNMKVDGKKTVLVAHSMGSSVVLYFFKWVEAEGEGYGNGGPTWVEDHIESFTSIAGTFLGVPKAMAALLSGEMRDTVELPPAAAFLLEKFFSRRERAKLFRSWAGSASMMIKGGDTIWGNATWAPDDEADASETHGNIYTFKQPALKDQMGASDGQGASDEQAEASPHDRSALDTAPKNLTATDALTWLLQHTPSSFQQMMAANYSTGMAFDEERVKLNDKREQTWANPLEAALPNAPSMSINCIYGVGKPTERSYYYAQGPYQRDEFIAEGSHAQCLNCGDNTTINTPLDFPTGRTGWIDNSVNTPAGSPSTRAGCKMGEGDGTVSLLSLGAMCVEGWKRKRYNPGGSRVITREIPHAPEVLDLRGGATTGDHVDILGNTDALTQVLRVAAGHEVEPEFHSRIREYAAKIDWDGKRRHEERTHITEEL